MGGGNTTVFTKFNIFIYNWMKYPIIKFVYDTQIQDISIEKYFKIIPNIGPNSTR